MTRKKLQLPFFTYEEVKDPRGEGLKARKTNPQVLQKSDENFNSEGKRNPGIKSSMTMYFHT